jgi:glycosyltransferase involved in cell wall biosynthesis
MLLSICIPTYKRIHCLSNCLNSILIAKRKFNFDFEVCISDNNTKEDVLNVVNFYKKKLKIKFSKNRKNLGVGKNILKVVTLAEGKYSWIIGNDDLLMPNFFKNFFKIIKNNINIDFFFVNSYHLDSKFIFSQKQPFNTKLLPNFMNRFSLENKDFKGNFFDLINPKITFDFFLGIYTAIFLTKKWNENLHIISKKLVSDKRIYSNFDNTAPHVKIFAKSFSQSKSYFIARPLSVNLYGVREWSRLYNFVEIIRIPEALDEFRKNGLSFFKYYYCKNYALRNFIPYLIKMILNYKSSGLKYVSFYKHIIKNLIFLNFYLSLLYFFIRKIRSYF